MVQELHDLESDFGWYMVNDGAVLDGTDFEFGFLAHNSLRVKGY